MKKKLFFLLFSLISVFLFSCTTPADDSTITVDSCTFEKEKDWLVITNQKENYKLEIYLYGNKIENGTYQVLGSDNEPELEGILIQNKVTRDVKTTLFIENSDNKIKAYGKAQLYKPNSSTKTDEYLDFCYEAELTRK